MNAICELLIVVMSWSWRQQPSIDMLYKQTVKLQLNESSLPTSIAYVSRSMRHHQLRQKGLYKQKDNDILGQLVKPLELVTTALKRL